MIKTSLLKINNLAISFPYGKSQLQVVRGVDLEVFQGEVVGILGESGSGKTVTASSIIGLTKDEAGSIDSGEILFKGENIVAMSEKELQRLRGKEIAYIFQDPVGSLNPYRKAGKQIEDALKVHHLPCSKQRVLQIMQDVGLDKVETIYNMFPSQLSGGQCQRILIASAIACKPDLLIADEPISAIDASLQKKVLSLLKDISKKYGTAIIMITHDFAVVKYLCDRVVVMYGGLVMETGTVKDVLENPLHPYTLELLKCVNSLNNRDERLYTLEGRALGPSEYIGGCTFYTRCSYKTRNCETEVPQLLDRPGGRQVRCLNAGSEEA